MRHVTKVPEVERRPFSRHLAYCTKRLEREIKGIVFDLQDSPMRFRTLNPTLKTETRERWCKRFWQFGHDNH